MKKIKIRRLKYRSIMGVFTKVIKDLDALTAQEIKKANKLMVIITRLNGKVAKCQHEKDRAKAMSEKLMEFVSI